MKLSILGTARNRVSGFACPGDDAANDECGARKWKVGDILTVSGENLDKAHVAELYLTDGKKDTKVEMREQAPTSIKFKIPVKARPGRFALMVLTMGKEPKLIEQPVKVIVE